MNKRDLTMNKLSKTIGGVVIAFVLVLSAVTIPGGSAIAVTDFNYNFSNSSYDTTTPGEWVYESESSVTECILEVSSDLVTIGDSINLSWYTTGFTHITVNGQVVTSPSGSVTIDNLQESTTFTLEALNDSGSRCTQQVIVTCIPPEEPKECTLEVQKSVNRVIAIPGQELTYTITVKNIGDAACTGSGVLIEDILDSNLTYLRHTVSSNFGAGYLDKPVYTSTDRTLHFNGFDLTPGELGTITWVGKVNTPAQCGDFEVKNQAKATALELNNFQTWAYSQTVKTSIDNDCPVPQPPVCTLVPTTQTVGYAGSAVLTWTTDRATTVTLTDFGTVALDGTVTTAALYANKTYTLRATGPDGEISCVANVLVTPEPLAPTCTLLPTTQTIQSGAAATLTWTTTNASVVTLTDFGTVARNGTGTTTALTANKSYSLVATGNGKTVTCTAAVVVTPLPVPSCDSFIANPTSIVKGASTTLSWQTTNATSVYINNGVGSVAADGSVVVSPLASLVYQLTVRGAGEQSANCSVPVTVIEPEEPVLSCADNVSFTVSPTTIRRGNSSTLSWSTTDVDTVSISGINATSLSGNQTVSPTSNTTYVLTATRGSQSVACPVTLAVTTGGGGGGGSVSPRCELTASKTKVNAGDRVTLTWDTSNATRVLLTDSLGEEYFTTDDYLSSEKSKYYDGDIVVRPTRTTTYTLLAERGSRDEECIVKVEVGGSVVVLETRDQQPLISGISLSQVPYTGFEAGPLMTALFYLILIAWSLLIAYLIVLRKQVVTSGTAVIESPIVVTQNQAAMLHAERMRPDVFTMSTAAPMQTDRRAHHSVPEDLPIGPVVVGYENLATAKEEPVVVVNPHQTTDTVVTALENRAHAQKALLSSDAIRHFIGTTDGAVDRHEALDSIIAEAKKMYPLEDGWIVVNESRMRNLCTVCKASEIASSKEPFIPATIPEGSGSLAEAIVTGNVVAAYQMIGNRPMFALADAAADLDSIYRIRQGGKAEVSELLKSETKNLSNEQIKNMITALTGALDGTYTDEASAVKMAIMKAVKAGA
jgi:uncharacterized repeat protein (TIGR01451 family)